MYNIMYIIIRGGHLLSNLLEKVAIHLDEDDHLCHFMI